MLSVLKLLTEDRSHKQPSVFTNSSRLGNVVGLESGLDAYSYTCLYY